MCGIYGYILPESKTDLSKQFNEDLSQSLHHRGPDDYGYYQFNQSLIGNARLSIIDIENGHQPIFSQDENVVVVQNGEIYNFIEVRQELEGLGHKFQTDSDTEVILEAYLEWGESFVEKLNGMFAIALIDKNLNRLFLFRDRLGVKPLYLYQKGDDFLFASEIKAFLRYEDFDKSINNQAICDYLVLNYVPLPQTIFQHVRHLEPGHYMVWDLKEASLIKDICYWDIAQIKENSEIPLEEYQENIESLLKNATEIRLRSDVEVGAFLSGGLDSSMVTALMREIRPNDRIQTFSVGFKEKEFDESAYAKYVAEKYSLDNDIFVLEGDIIDYWKRVTFHNDQPHGDISFIPTFILSERTSEHLKVVLTGDGGDELFAGYLKYLELEEHQNTEKYFANSSVFSPMALEEVLSPEFAKSVDKGHARSLFDEHLEKVSHKDLINKVLYYEVKQLLPGNNLVKPDKMAMANSLETRSPFMDYRLYEYTSQIPGAMKLKDGDTKHILKKLALDYFSEEHVYRRKQMFTVPVGEWFKNKLSGFLMDILQSESLETRKIFDRDKVLQMADDHINERANYTRELRAIVNLEIWFRLFIDEK